MGYDYPDYRRGTLEKGFVLEAMIPIQLTIDLAGGATQANQLSIPPDGRFEELLALTIYCTQTPAAPPEVQTMNYVAGALRYGISRVLTLGYTTDFYELDLSTMRIYAYYNAPLYQALWEFLTAHAVNATRFYTVGLIARYAFAT